jgi:hypothetical protein
MEAGSLAELVRIATRLEATAVAPSGRSLRTDD